MAIVQDNLTALTLGGTSSLTYTYSHTVNSNTNGCLIVSTLEDGGSVDDLTGVTYNGVAMTMLKSVGRNNGSYPFMKLWGLLSPSTGANNVVISRSNTSGDIQSGAVSFTGVKQSGLPDATASNTSGSATSITATLTTTANNCIAVGISAANLPIASTGCTSLSATSNCILVKSSSFPITPAGSYPMTIVCTSGVIGLAVVSLAPVASTTGNFLMFM